MTEFATRFLCGPTPANMDLMGAKDALTKTKDMDFGLPDTLGCYSPAEFKQDFQRPLLSRSAS